MYALLSGTVEAWSVPRPRVSSSDSPRVGAYGGLDGASHSWPFKYRNNRTFGESNPARITLPFDKIIREYNFGGDASLCDVRSPRRRTDTHRVDVLRAVKLCWADGVRLSVAKGSPTFIASTTAGEGSPR